ncbi:hypothetical protein MAR_023036 [Mya arenaria]|uniref:Uncharacterized protein n=1 Tax=Mya arenaria TaxID=6604 RepID=A0ABY7DP70_MYAAR|nr:hypothetical protein MAR_023036 [Mya arenaria]
MHRADTLVLQNNAGKHGPSTQGILRINMVLQNNAVIQAFFLEIKKHHFYGIYVYLNDEMNR